MRWEIKTLTSVAHSHDPKCANCKDFVVLYSLALTLIQSMSNKNTPRDSPWAAHGVTLISCFLSSPDTDTVFLSLIPLYPYVCFSFLPFLFLSLSFFAPNLSSSDPLCTAADVIYPQLGCGVCWPEGGLGCKSLPLSLSLFHCLLLALSSTATTNGLLCLLVIYYWSQQECDIPASI